MACDEFERVNKGKALKVDAVSAQNVARRADVDRERATISSTIPSPTHMRENDVF